MSNKECEFMEEVGKFFARLINWRSIMKIIKELFRIIIMLFTLIILVGTAFVEWLGRNPSYQEWYKYNEGIIDILPFRLNHFFKRIFNKKQQEVSG